MQSSFVQALNEGRKPRTTYKKPTVQEVLQSQIDELVNRVNELTESQNDIISEIKSSKPTSKTATQVKPVVKPNAETAAAEKPVKKVTDTTKD